MRFCVAGSEYPIAGYSVSYRVPVASRAESAPAGPASKVITAVTPANRPNRYFIYLFEHGYCRKFRAAHANRSKVLCCIAISFLLETRGCSPVDYLERRSSYE
jgi:hypothetical protein